MSIFNLFKKKVVSNNKTIRNLEVDDSPDVLDVINQSPDILDIIKEYDKKTSQYKPSPDLSISEIDKNKLDILASNKLICNIRKTALVSEYDSRLDSMSNQEELNERYEAYIYTSSLSIQIFFSVMEKKIIYILCTIFLLLLKPMLML